jgi:hypothetical protein
MGSLLKPLRDTSLVVARLPLLRSRAFANVATSKHSVVTNRAERFRPLLLRDRRPKATGRLDCLVTSPRTGESSLTIRHSTSIKSKLQSGLASDEFETQMMRGFHSLTVHDCD